MTEFTGIPNKNTIQPNSVEALSAADKLRLVYLTASENIDAEPFTGAFDGDAEEV